LICAVLLALPARATGAKGGVSFGAVRDRFLDSQDVDVELVNGSDRRIELFGGAIRAAGSGDVMVRLRPESRFLPPGAEHAWTWLHNANAGIFRATFRTSVGTFTDTFEIGAFFTLGFRCDDDPKDCPDVDPFVIFVRQEKPIRHLRNDLNRDQAQRRIVSGIVRGKARYNSNWSYTMNPGSIVLGEVFTEGCDAHPNAVEGHRRRWKGERWCPWSSYVASEGR
jgi:hypothetical protein